MGMVMLMQQHQQTSEGIAYQKDQERVKGILTSENCDPEVCRAVVCHPRKENEIVVVRNGSLAGSSTQCSDVENDEDEEETDIEDGEWLSDLSLPTAPAVIQQQQQVSTTNGDLVLPNAEPSVFGDVCVKNSRSVHLGNKTFYNGPVTIKQFVYTNPTSILDADAIKSYPARPSDANASDLSATKSDSGANKPILPDNAEYNTVTKWLWTWRCAAFLCVVALILVTIVVIGAVYLARSPPGKPTPDFPSQPDSGLEGGKVRNVRFVERNEWIAQPPAGNLTKLKHPVPYVIISHTATDFCTTQSECTLRVRFSQTFHIESRNWSDIAYNFLVGGDGLAYVGRSWDYVGAHSFGYNDVSIGISFIGTFNSVTPPGSQLFAAQRIIELGVESGKIARNYKLLGHRQISKTLSPGGKLYSIIQTWPHWSSEV